MNTESNDSPFNSKGSRSSSSTSLSSSTISLTVHGLVKGNINYKGEKIYHVPGGEFYDKTVPKEWFNTEADAQAVGYRRSKR